MFEMLTNAGEYTYPRLNSGYVSQELITPQYPILNGCFFEYNSVLYAYGGQDASGNPTNSLFTFTRTTAMTPAVEFSLGSTPICYPRAHVVGTKVFLLGATTSNNFGVKIIDMVTKTSEDIFSNIGTGAWYDTVVSPGTDYVPGRNEFYLKFAGSNKIGVYNATTKSFSELPLTNIPNDFVGNEYIVYGARGIYTLGGWNVTEFNRYINYIPFNGGPIVRHATLENANFHSVNQGSVVKNGVCFYPTWMGSSISFNAFDPETKRQGEPPLNTGIGYRNVTCIGRWSGGFIYGGGTNIPVGSSGWKTNGRQGAIYIVTVDFSKNN